MSNVEKETQQVNQNQDAALAGAQLEQAEGTAAVEVEEYELTFTGADTHEDASEGKQDSVTNAFYANQRIERKRLKQLEEENERLKRGEISDDLRVQDELPSQPVIDDFLSDESLEKYGYDRSVAMAAFNQATSAWMIKAMDARSTTQSKQAQAITQRTQQNEISSQAWKSHYDTAEKFNIKDFDAIEGRVQEALGNHVYDNMIQLFPDKSAAMTAHLDANPAKLARINALVASGNPIQQQRALIELGDIAKGLNFTRKSNLSSAPPADQPLTGDTSHSRTQIESLMNKAAIDGNHQEYARLKALLRS